MPNFSLPGLSSFQQSQLLRAARQVLETQQQMTTARGRNIIHYTLEKKRKHVSMNHYPKGDRIDHQTGAQYFYHCHRENFESMEHGHFHCFLRYKGIPARIKPTALPDWDKYIDNPMTHLVAIAMNCYGQPIRLFTVNRWVSSDIIYDARHVAGFIRRFKMTLNDSEYWQVLDRWVQGMLRLFSPQIVWLHEQRQQRMREFSSAFPEENAYESRDIEEPSQIEIDLNTQIQWLLNPASLNQAEDALS
ncbi:hypothetical protein DIZ81_03090 [Legionella taurinensis]|uniref:DUF6969 domain-containing protein n=2 Tax=Legionella taurinensis TaxID=70611 RepID=A0A3A5L4J0_9GAMM|nr:hypothetical protein [Legionella taurinensis]MDX1836140.1 hypothetical protein [Legionella taurinensis]PUT42088.1 hypothetical protein DB744_03095 [Legionella taurinensis]PUT44875.1 hypothetical protein DB746_03095 [Legionella taurinensis]PUT48196.1 hypothetical protein DB743_01255 [Legionella taurinensis]PUT49010.1 hypothetical protein DB745_03095 [Legionella taurinensis]